MMESRVMVEPCIQLTDAEYKRWIAQMAADGIDISDLRARGIWIMDLCYDPAPTLAAVAPTRRSLWSRFPATLGSLTATCVAGLSGAIHLCTGVGLFQALGLALGLVTVAALVIMRGTLVVNRW